MIALPMAAKCCLRAFYLHLLPHFADEPSGGGSTPAELSPSALRLLAWNKKREASAKETRRLLASIHEHHTPESEQDFQKGQGRPKDEKMIYKMGFSGDESSNEDDSSSSSASSSKELLDEDKEVEKEEVPLEEEEEVPPTQFAYPPPHAQLPPANVEHLLPPLEPVPATPAAAKPPVKCSTKHCTRPGDSFPLMECALSGCTHEVHYPCYLQLLTKGRSTEYTAAEGGIVLCTIDHHKKYKKYKRDLNTGGGYKWENDGAGGKTDPKHSHFYLLQWLEDPSNYAKWKGPPGAQTKSSMSGLIGTWIHRQGTKKLWSAAQVNSKIMNIERKMRTARGIKDGTVTGAGLTDKDRAMGIMTLDDKASCSFYLLVLHLRTTNTQFSIRFANSAHSMSN